MIDNLFTIDPWPHQRQGVEETIHALTNGCDSVCLTGPTGSGKTLEMIALTRWALNQNCRVGLFTNRILLTQQTRQVFEDASVEVGVVSASMKHYEYKKAPVQIATIQTVLSRRKASPSYWLDCDLLLVDEPHQQSSGESADLLLEYRQRGTKLCGTTATPLGISHIYQTLVVAGRTRDLQKDGILCRAVWFAPSELDTRNLVKGKVDLSLTETDARRTWGPLRGDDQIRTRIVGNIIEHYQRLHPEGTHTLAFAPGVRESLWAAQYCRSRGIRTLHIDGQDFWLDGEVYDRKQDETKFHAAMQEWRDGEIPLIWNRFVMREGIDEPRIECIMLATPVGSFRSAVQMVGRGLRDPSAKNGQCIVIDFGGNWWRHFAPDGFNVNIDWEEVFECDDPDVLGKNRIARIRETGESVGRACPNCGMVHKGKSRFICCQYCGHEISLGKPSRPIIQADGTLTIVEGEPIKQWKIVDKPDNAKRWKSLYWNAVRHKGGEATFNQLYSQFGYKIVQERGWGALYYPSRNTPLMPKHPNDWHRCVKDVDIGDLY